MTGTTEIDQKIILRFTQYKHFYVLLTLQIGFHGSVGSPMMEAKLTTLNNKGTADKAFP